MKYLVFDLIIAAVLVIFTLQGKRKGFVLTLCGLLAVFVAFIGAAFLSDLMCQPVGRLLQPVLEESISETLHEIAGQNVQMGRIYSDPFTTVELAVAALEGSELFELFGQTLKTALAEGLLQGSGSVTGSIAAYLAREVARIVLFVLSFVVILLVWFMLSHVLDLAFRLPVLSSVNAALGGVLGLIKGGLLVFIAVWLLKEHIPAQAVEDTVLLQFFCRNSPLSLVTQQLHLAKMVWTIP